MKNTGSGGQLAAFQSQNLMGGGDSGGANAAGYEAARQELMSGKRARSSNPNAAAAQ